MPNSDLYGKIHRQETLSALDGPGIRYVVFLQGCLLTCCYCHNPDAQDINGGYELSVKDIIDDIKKYSRFHQNGGLTISGGEPLMQADFTKALVKAARDEKIHCAIDTSGAINTPAALKALAQADLVILDIKAFDQKTACQIGAGSLEPPFSCLAACEKNKTDVWIRHVLLPGMTIFCTKKGGIKEFIKANQGLVAGAKRLRATACIRRIELVPFHNMGAHKYDVLGRFYACIDASPPDDASMDYARRIFCDAFKNTDVVIL